MEFYVLHERTHVLLLFSLQSFHWWVDIMLSTNDIHTLVDIVIVDPTQVDLVSHATSSCGVAVIVTIQGKERL